MTAANDATSNPNEIVLTQTKDDDPDQVWADAMLGQNLRHGHMASVYAKPMVAATGEKLNLMACARFVQKRATDAINGDLSFASAMLASQAVTLDSIFTEMARRSAENVGRYPDAMERYMRLALKAQANSRATLESLAKLHQPREQTVRHVHVNEGGQAVIADQFHHHTGIAENANRAEQSHEQGALGSPVPGTQPCGQPLPVPGEERAQALSSPWGTEPRRADRKPTRAKARRTVG